MAGGLKIALAGVGKVLKAAERVGERYQHAMEAALYGLGNEIMTDSKRRVPVDFGALKGSGYVTMPVADARTITVELGFGGPAKAYAVVQHERTEFHHEVGEAKFLENAINAASGGAARRVVDLAHKAFAANVRPSRGEHPVDPDQGQTGGGKQGSG